MGITHRLTIDVARQMNTHGLAHNADRLWTHRQSSSAETAWPDLAAECEILHRHRGPQIIGRGHYGESHDDAALAVTRNLMGTDSGSAETARPTTSDLTSMMGLLRMPGDPVYLLRDHADARGRAELLAHVSAWVAACLRQAEKHAGLSVDDSADLHWRADSAVASGIRRPPEPDRVLGLQIDRLTWVHHTITQARAKRPDYALEVASTTVAAVIQLLMAVDDDHEHGAASHPVDPVLTDCLVALGEAADRALRGLRQCRPASIRSG